MTYFAPNQLGTTPEEVLASLEGLGINYFIWDRLATNPEDWRSTLLSMDFLQTYTRILDGDQSGYLFEVLPQGGDTWGVRKRNLLRNPRFERVKDGGPWTVVGQVDVDGGVSVQNGTDVQQRVEISGGTPYLLVTTSKCAGPADRAAATLVWFDNHGVVVSTTFAAVVPGVEQSDQFLWIRAPDRATSSLVVLGAWEQARCDLAEAGLFRIR